MATDLAGVRTQVRALLIDAGSAIWSNDTIDQAARQVLGDFYRVYGAAVTLKDLDSAASTTVEDPDISVLVLGAAGYAAESRIVDLSEMHTLGDEVPSGLENAAKYYKSNYRSLLTVIKKRKMAKASAVPYTVMVEDADEDATMEWDE